MIRRHIQYESIQSKTILNRVSAPSMPFEWSINPYRGCQHGCSFCYARATHSFLGMETDDTFQNHILIKSNAAEALRDQLNKAVRSRKGIKNFGRIAIGTATDPYQPVEAKSLLTRQCLEVLAEYKIPTSITTRSPLILRDIDLLKQIPITSINLSVNTVNPTIWKNLEPSTPSPEKRLETVRNLVDEGIRSGIFLAPILPLLTDSVQELSAAIEAAAKHKSQFVMPSYLRLSTSEVKVWFFQTMEQHYPNLVQRYGELYHHSAYLPRYYREATMKTIHTLLDKNGISALERTNSPEVKKEPVQLSFSF
jgi:DNA repair photolyase